MHVQTETEESTSLDGSKKRCFVMRAPKFEKYQGNVVEVPGHSFLPAIQSQVPERWRETPHRNYMTASLDMLRNILLHLSNGSLCISNLGDSQWLIYDKGCSSHGSGKGQCLIIHTVLEESTHMPATGEFVPSITFRFSNLKDEGYLREQVAGLQIGISIPEVYGRYAYGYFKKMRWQKGLQARMGIVTKALPKLPEEIQRLVANAYGDAKFTLQKDTIKGLSVCPLLLKRAIDNAMASQNEVTVPCRFSKGCNRSDKVGRFIKIFAAEFYGSSRTIFDIQLSSTKGRPAVAIMMNRQKDSSSPSGTSGVSTLENFVVLDFVSASIHVHCSQSLAKKQIRIVSGSARCMWETQRGLSLLGCLVK